MNNVSTIPMSAGIYLCTRDSDVFLIVIKGICPCLKIEKGFNLGEYLRSQKKEDVSKEALANIATNPEKWTFKSTKGIIDYSVFSKNEFHATGELDLPYDIKNDLREKYYALVQQGVSSTKIRLALMYEFKVSSGTIDDLINGFDKEV